MGEGAAGEKESQCRRIIDGDKEGRLRSLQVLLGSIMHAKLFFSCVP